MNRLITAIAVVVVVAAAGFGYITQRKLAQQETRQDQPPQATSSRRPDFSLTDTNGVDREISEWDGKTIALNFWATWCPPCRKEIPVLIEVQNDYADQGLQIIGLAIDEMELVQSYAEEMEINYPLLVGEQEALNVAEAFGTGVTALPFTVIINPDGEVKAVHYGELHREELLALVEPHL
ncbi:MAG: TlpA disulfide reductase family protein [Pseudomonadota bacterium]